MANDTIQRHQIADYLNCSKNGVEDFQLMGTGFNTLDESPGAQTDSKTYINDKSATSYIKSYETVFPFESDMIKNQTTVMELYSIGRDHLTGSEAQREYVRVDLYDPVAGLSDTYKARKFLVSVEVSDCKGGGGETIVVSGNLNAVGDPKQGYFNTVTKKFTETVTTTLTTLTVTSSAGSSTGNTAIQVTPALTSGNSYKYKLGSSALNVTFGQDCVLLDDWNGTDEIAATTGQTITVIEVDANNKAVGAGSATVTTA